MSSIPFFLMLTIRDRYINSFDGILMRSFERIRFVGYFKWKLKLVILILIAFCLKASCNWAKSLLFRSKLDQGNFYIKNKGKVSIKWLKWISIFYNHFFGLLYFGYVCLLHFDTVNALQSSKSSLPSHRNKNKKERPQRDEGRDPTWHRNAFIKLHCATSECEQYYTRCLWVISKRSAKRRKCLCTGASSRPARRDSYKLDNLNRQINISLVTFYSNT